MDSVFDTIAGLPIHPLVVHAVVMLLPLSAIGLIACVLRPAWRQRFGILVVLGALGGAVAWGLGLPVFLVVLYVFFENFGRLLPGNY